MKKILTFLALAIPITNSYSQISIQKSATVIADTTWKAEWMAAKEKEAKTNNEIIERAEAYGDLFLMKKQYAEAITFYDSALSIENNDYTYFLNGYAKFKLKDFTGAIADLSKAIQLSKDKQKDGNWRYEQRSLLFYDKEGDSNYIAPVYSGWSYEHKYSDAYYYRGVCKSRLQDYKSAILDFDKCILVNKEYFPPFYERAIAKFYIKDYLGAKADYSEAIKIDNENGELYYNRAVCNNELHLIDSACKDFSKAGELGYKDAYKAIEQICNK